MKRLAAAFVGIQLVALILYGLAPLAIERAPEALMHLWRDLAWAAACYGGVLIVVLPILYLRARLWERRAERRGVWINGQHYTDWRD